MGTAFVFYFLTLYVVNTRSEFAFTVRGNITADETGAPYDVGDNVNFNFYFLLNGETNVTELMFKFTSDTLMFLPESSETVSNQISWFYNKAEANATNILQDRNSSLNFSETYNADSNSISISFPFRGWASEEFYGLMKMVVRDQIGPGRKLNCKAAISYYLDGSFINREIDSTTTYSELPSLSLTLDYPVYLKVLESTTVKVAIDLPPGSIEGSVQVVMPISSTGNEMIPQMSVNGFRVDANQTVPADQVAALSCTYDSQSLTGTNDLALVDPIVLTKNDTDAQGSDLELKFDVQAEIYRGIENLTEIWIGGGMKFGESFLWVAEIPVVLLDDYDRFPKLNYSVTYLSEQGHDGTMVATFEVALQHEGSSTDHAFDITMVMYLTPVMTSVAIVESVSLGYHGAVMNSNRFIFTMEKTILGTNPSFKLNISFNVGDSRFWDTDTFVLISELFYYGGYKNSSEYRNDLQHTMFQLNIQSAEQITFTDAGTCVCAFDISRSDCACCRPGGCQCGATNPSKCSDCRKPWRCQPHLNGFEQETNLNGEYVCRAYQLYKALESGVSCYKEKSAGVWIGVSQAVGVILGRDSNTGTLYAVGNTGDSYMESGDQGLTWASINSDTWTAMSGSSSYVHVAFGNY